jgi:peptidoglycan/xylan/chitin deacetylase (PgdA/CDA1 family)
VSLDDVGAALEGRWTPRRPIAALTFDDGYRGTYDHALPLLVSKGVPMAVFVVTDLLGDSSPPAHDRLYRLLLRASGRRSAPLGLDAGGGRLHEGDADATTRVLVRVLPEPDLLAVMAALERVDGPLVDRERAQTLTWAMAREMVAEGVTVGSHTRSHPMLTNCSAEQALEQLASSRQRLEEGLGVPVKHFAYPDGQFNPTVVDAVARAGYRYAFTICSHRDERYPFLTIPRTVLWQRSSIGALGAFSPAVLECQTLGLLDRLNVCRRQHAPLRPALSAA